MGLMDLFRKKTSGDIAKDRLKLLLVSDRASCSPEIMEQIKNDIIEVISKYMDIDPQGLDIQITETESESGNHPHQGSETPFQIGKRISPPESALSGHRGSSGDFFTLSRIRSSFLWQNISVQTDRHT